MTMQNSPTDWWKDWLASGVLEWDEPAQYYSSPTGMAFGQGSPRKRRYFSNAYEDIFKEFLGAAGTSLRAGQAPTTFMDFMKTNPWTKGYSSLPQASRGVTGQAANPRTRFLYNF
jgi:hypothetical protein|tara:strand:- start:2647 stop:2991 length:345 start_codon:yes stop_codon:yes gene_type:complete